VIAEIVNERPERPVRRIGRRSHRLRKVGTAAGHDVLHHSECKLCAFRFSGNHTVYGAFEDGSKTPVARPRNRGNLLMELKIFFELSGRSDRFAHPTIDQRNARLLTFHPCGRTRRE
jgi:hypothetical protein